MTFTDLPDDWPSRSLADPALAADVIDLLVLGRDRPRDVLLLQPCRADGVPMPGAVVIEGVRWGATREQRAATIAFLDELAPGAVILAMSRRWGTPQPDDQLWVESARDVCAASGIELLGVYLATGSGVFPVPGSLARPVSG